MSTIIGEAQNNPNKGNENTEIWTQVWCQNNKTISNAVEKQLETGKLRTYETVHSTQKDRANIDIENQDEPGGWNG